MRTTTTLTPTSRSGVVPILAGLVVTLLLTVGLIQPPASSAAVEPTSWQHPAHNHATFIYDGSATTSTASSRSNWGDHPVRVQAHGTAADGVISVRAHLHPGFEPIRTQVVHVEDLIIEVTVTDPDGHEHVAQMTAASAIVTAATPLALTTTLPAGGPGEYTLTAEVAYTVVPAPAQDPDPAQDPEPVLPPEPTAPTPPTPTRPPVAQQAATPAGAARPVSGSPAYTG